jgi:hypothetical protein
MRTRISSVGMFWLEAKTQEHIYQPEPLHIHNTDNQIVIYEADSRLLYMRLIADYYI